MGGYKALVSAGCPGDRGERGLGLQETYNVIHMYISSGMKKIIIIIKKSGSNMYRLLARMSLAPDRSQIDTLSRNACAHAREAMNR